MRNMLFALTVMAMLGVMSVLAAKPTQPPVAATNTGGQGPENARQAVPLPPAVLDQYCVSCHSERLKTAGLVLEKVDTENIGANAQLWEKVAQKLRFGTMPPRGARRPDSATTASLASSIEDALDRAAVSHRRVGRTGIHRLNRIQYVNAIKDVLGVEVDGPSLLPSDEQAYGFDNIAEALSVTPGLLDRYLTAAARISQIAVGDLAIRPTIERYVVQKNLWQSDRLGEEFPWGSRGGASLRHYFPVDGEYAIQVRVSRTYNNLIRGLDVANEIAVLVDGRRVGGFTVGGKVKRNSKEFGEYLRTADDGLEIRVPIQAGARQILVTLVKTVSSMAEGLGPARMPIWDFSYASDPDTEMGISTVQITGPYKARVPESAASRQRVFICHPAAGRDEVACAARILTTVARRAYRRPVSNDDTKILLAFFESGRAHGGFEAGIRSGLEMILMSPDFLFRTERDPPSVMRGTAHRVSDIELASRLSFFLWSSVPDDQLLTLAEQGKLGTPAVLEQQVRRMLAEPRAQEALLDNFMMQWLQVRNVSAVTPDTSTKFPDFNDNLRGAFEKETELFLRSQLKEDTSALELLTANYTFLNEQLARHYGITDVHGSHFRRVTHTDENRFGLLGQASILTITSQPNRTSPTIRGKWLLDNLLGTPIPPPPADVPALQETGAAGKPATIRDALEQHRTNPACASCHLQMDPPGLGLENFDGVGRWRTTDNGRPIDASSVLADGTKFRGPAELRKALLDRKDQIVGSITRKLLTYSLGRDVEYYEAPVVRQIVREAAPDYRWSSLILGIVKSPSFQMRMSK